MPRQKIAHRTNEYGIRKSAITRLLSEGISRGDIRLEITLDTSSSGGRADIVLLRDNAICGVELKSCLDKTDRAEQQIKSYGFCFDHSFLLSSSRHGEWLKSSSLRYTNRLGLYCPESRLFTDLYGHPYDDNRAITSFPALTTRISRYKNHETNTAMMARLLWRSEATEIARQAGLRYATRHCALNDIQEHMALKDLRPHVIAALRERPLNNWETAFWQQFDADGQPDSIGSEAGAI